MSLYKTLFPLYFLLLACLPCLCSDRVEGFADACEVSMTHNDDHPCDAAENCTPFCVCASCASVCNPPAAKPELKAAFVIVQSPYCGDLPYNYNSTFPGSIWQPPRFV